MMESLERLNGPDESACIAVCDGDAQVPNAFQCVLLCL
jgi:hypothetical protein